MGKMKNKEKYAKDIAESAIKSDHYFAYDKTLKRVVPCYKTSCNNCLFYDGAESCKKNRFYWANTEYEAPGQVKETEKEIVKVFPVIESIARDKDGGLTVIFGLKEDPSAKGWSELDKEKDGD